MDGGVVGSEGLRILLILLVAVRSVILLGVIAGGACLAPAALLHVVAPAELYLRRSLAALHTCARERSRVTPVAPGLLRSLRRVRIFTAGVFTLLALVPVLARGHAFERRCLIFTFIAVLTCTKHHFENDNT